MSVLKGSKPTKAFASVIFEDDIEVECRIISGRNGLWVA
ncbi:MAG: SpoVG family protein [Endomicrobium sp.]|jgi:DNA-binding cell septation regulator SpoVG|nr:SpoVG family protein [Endomicrobium sp.]